MPPQIAVHDQFLDTAVAAAKSREPGGLEALNELPAPIYVTDADGTRYTYKVFEEFTVGPSDTSVTNTEPGKNILTLQTCTLPDYSRRLIVQAERVEGPAASTPGEDGA